MRTVAPSTSSLQALTVSRARSGRTVLVGVGLLVMFLWMAMRDFSLGGGSVRGTFFYNLLGATGMHAFGWVCAAITAGLLVATIRRTATGADLVRIEPGGIAYDGLLGSGFAPWSEIDKVETSEVRVAGRTSRFIDLAPGHRVSLQAVAASDGEIDAWVAAANSAHPGR